MYGNCSGVESSVSKSTYLYLHLFRREEPGIESFRVLFPVCDLMSFKLAPSDPDYWRKGLSLTLTVTF